jgi:hypothetical protein
MYSLSAQLRSTEDSLRRAIGNAAATSSLTRRRLVAGILAGLLCVGIIVYSAYRISSAQGDIATYQHHDQEATSSFVLSVQQGLIGHYQQSNNFHKYGVELQQLNGPLITQAENVQSLYSLPLIFFTALLGALLGWALTEMLRVRRHKAPSGHGQQGQTQSAAPAAESLSRPERS